MSTTIADNIAAVEHALLTGIWPKDIGDASEVVQLARFAVHGDYTAVLTSQLANRLLKRPEAYDAQSQSRSVAELLSHIQPSGPEEELLCLVILCAALHAFLQANWTGPELPSSLTPLSVLQVSEDTISDDQMNTNAIAELAYGGEPAYHLALHAAFLRIAQVLAKLPYSHATTIPWWQLRIWTTHLYLLDGPVAIPTDVSATISGYRPLDSDLTGRYLLELGLLSHLLHSDKKASEQFVDAAKSTGLQYELTGALGKRTKFQIHEHIQLVLLAESRNDSSPSTKTVIPETLDLNDDTLLEHTQFTSSTVGASVSSALAHLDPGNQPELDPLDQCILLAMCLNVRNTSPTHGLTNEQMAPYVERVVTHPRNWSIHTMALLLRSRLESGRTRTIERSTLQLQALIDQMPTSDSAPDERLRYIFDLALPSKWELERELANRMLSLGVVKSALDIFTRLEMWEEAVRCYAMLEMREAGIKIVSDLLSGVRVDADQRSSRHPISDNVREAKLVCLLGDFSPLDEREEHYRRAWTLSKQTSGRAARSLGAFYFAQKRYLDSISFLEHGARINPLLSRTWFLLGCAHMRSEKPDWLSAREAFARCVAIDEEDSEAWSNLATCYLQMSDEQDDLLPSDTSHEVHDTSDDDARPEPLSRRERQYASRLAAFRALREGLKHAHDNWRMWENYLLVTLEVGELHECVRALGRVVELRNDGTVDDAVLDRLVDASVLSGATAVDSASQTLQAIPENAESHIPVATPGSLAARVTDLFDRILLPRVSTPRVFRAYARLSEAQGAYTQALKAYLDAHRTAQPVQPPQTLDDWKVALNETEETLDALRKIGPKTGDERWRVQARGIVRSFVSRSRDFTDEADWTRVETMQEEVKKRDD